MKRALGAGFVLASLAVAGAFGEDVPNPALTDAEFKELTALIDESQAFVMGLITGLTDEQWNFKQNPERWSVGECVEHIARSEMALLERVKQMNAGPADPEWFAKTDGKTAMLRQAVPARGAQGQGGFKAPAEIQPTAKWGRAEGIREFYKSHGAVRSYIETMDRKIKDRTMDNGAPIGWLNGYDTLNLLALHAVRHGKQIAEVQADSNYPKKLAAAPAKEGDPNLTEADFAQLVKDIDEGQAKLLGLITNMTDEQWTFKENPDRWSVGECVEHITLGPLAILQGIEAVRAGGLNPNWYEQTKGKYQLVRQSVGNRPAGGVGSPFKAPGEVAPSGTWDRARGIAEFYTAYGELRAFVETAPPDIKAVTFMNPFPQIGLLNAHDWLTLMAIHTMRHSQQIAEVQANPKYPR